MSMADILENMGEPYRVDGRTAYECIANVKVAEYHLKVLALS